MLRVPPHRASSDAVASVWTCSSGASERPPAQPTTRRTAHPIRKIPTTAMRCPWRTTAHPPSLGMHPLLLAPPSMPQGGVRRISQEGLFTQVRGREVLRSSRGPVQYLCEYTCPPSVLARLDRAPRITPGLSWFTYDSPRNCSTRGRACQRNTYPCPCRNGARPAGCRQNRNDRCHPRRRGCPRLRLPTASRRRRRPRG